MPRFSASMTQGCQAGAGVLTLTQVGAPVGTSGSLTYRWYILDANQQDYGSAFSPSDIPYSIENLPNGAYSSFVEATDDQGATSDSRSFQFNIACGPPLVLDSLTATGATATTGGTITVQASGGVNPLTATVVELNLTTQLQADGQGKFTTTFPNIPAGTYTVQVADNMGQAVQGTVTVTAATTSIPPVLGCTDPTATNYNGSATQDDGSCTYAPVVRAPYFRVPQLQSLRFVEPGGPAFDNTLLADETPLDFTNPGYCQKVEQADRLVIQVLSNYSQAPVLKLYNSSTAQVALTATGIQVQQGAGETAAFDVYIKPDVLGRVRVYFNQDALPLPFLPGGRITLSGTGTSLDGMYPIQQVLEDPAAGVPYLVVVAAYPTGSIRVDGSLTTAYKIQVYDTYQLVLPFTSVPAGNYVARITATDPDFTTGLAISEPIWVKVKHQDTLLIAYRNFDNAFDLNYSHGLVNRLRVTGRFFHRQTGTEKNVLRDNDDTLVILTAHARRNVELETLLLPGWLHEVLAVAFCHDYTTIQGVQGTVAGEYTYTVVERYTLGKGTASLEVKPFLRSGNRDDLGDVDAADHGPYLIASDDLYLKTLFT